MCLITPGEEAEAKRGRRIMSQTEEAAFPLVAVAVDKDKGSQNALKWALDNVVTKGQTITLIHVNTKPTGLGQQEDPASAGSQSKEFFVPFRCFCTRKNVHCKDIILEDTDIARAIIEFVSQAAIEKLVVGAPSKSGFVRFRTTDTATNISKAAPDFCTVYIISKGKVSSMRNAVRPPPAFSPLRSHIQSQASIKAEHVDPPLSSGVKGEAALQARHVQSEREPIRSPFTRGPYAYNAKAHTDSIANSDISFVSGGRPSIDRIFNPRLSMSDGLDDSFEMQSPRKSMGGGYSFGTGFSSISQDSTSSSLNMEDVEAEMKRLRLELKQTMEMYSTACKEALTAKQKAMELHRWKMEEERRLEEARLAEEAALALAEKEKARCKAAIEAAEASKRIAELEAQKRINAEMKVLKEAEEKKRALDALAHTDVRYRKYTIEEIEAATENFSEKRKIGEGGYGPVYKGYLDHTAAAIKVLRPDAAQGRSQFQQEVEILSCIRHPNMVLLLGACPEYGCLVYEYMANGSLEDRLFRQGNTPPIPWQHRFRIAAEIGTGLLFLHETKPEPLVHRDLKPANILLDQNYVSKISDVGLARLVPPSVAENVTQYRMTSTAGTFCYIDPEYQQTGMLGVKSDIYSLGVMLLQLITARPPMGLTHHVERAIEKGTFAEMLDPLVTDWPVEDALSLAKIALKCAELRRKDRPDLATVVFPELERLRNFAEQNMQGCVFLGKSQTSSMHSQISLPDVLSGPLPGQSGYGSSITQSSASSMYARRASAA
ncbi:U-box domain-containing protein 35 [Elaeis guineensis]|uniref:RING-type E3 ubiquitin transferase n=1 Tax=Elaeis guineensis var. tenera TaxID=51953 RepID=A0A6J0PKW9_ELAGV|nr:U-box domain-containing protein 35 [Elaeis guineensis]